MICYSEHCSKNIINNNNTQYKHAHLTTMFERGKFEIDDFSPFTPETYLKSGYNN